MTQITSVPFHGTNILTDEDGTHVLLRPIAEALCLDAYFNAGGAINPRATEHQINALTTDEQPTALRHQPVGFNFQEDER